MNISNWFPFTQNMILKYSTIILLSIDENLWLLKLGTTFRKIHFPCSRLKSNNTEQIRALQSYFLRHNKATHPPLNQLSYCHPPAPFIDCIN